MDEFDNEYYNKFISSSMQSDDDERFVSSAKIENDEVIENILRPKSMDEYVGQKKSKRKFNGLYCRRKKTK